MHSLGLFTNGDISSAFLGISILLFHFRCWHQEKTESGVSTLYSSLFSYQWDLMSLRNLWVTTTGEMEKFGGGTVLVHLMFICHMTTSPLCLQINFGHLCWKEHLSSFSPILKSHYFTPVKSTSILLKTQ